MSYTTTKTNKVGSVYDPSDTTYVWAEDWNTFVLAFLTHASRHANGGGDELSVEGLSGKLADAQTPLSHTHAESDVTNLVTDLSGKAASSHTHAESDITNLVTDLAGKAATVHTHAEADITGLVTDLAAKASTTLFHYIPIMAKDFKVAAAEAGYWNTDTLSNGIPEVRMTYTHSEAHNAYATVIMPQDWDGGNLKMFCIWKTADSSPNTFFLDVYAVRFADDSTRNVAISTKVTTITDDNNGLDKVNQSGETSNFTITGTGKTIEFKFTRGYASDSLSADVQLLGVMLKCIVTKV